MFRRMHGRPKTLISGLTMVLCRAFGLGLLLFSVTLPAFAQTYLSGVRGAVRDFSGGVLPGATVTLTDEATNIPRTTLTNQLGEYVFAGIAPGTYNLDFARKPLFPIFILTDF